MLKKLSCENMTEKIQITFFCKYKYEDQYADFFTILK